MKKARAQYKTNPIIFRTLNILELEACLRAKNSACTNEQLRKTQNSLVVPDLLPSIRGGSVKSTYFDYDRYIKH